MLSLHLSIVVITMFSCFGFSPSPLPKPQYRIEHIYNPLTGIDFEVDAPIYRVLRRLDPINFPSLSQAKRAVEYGRLLVIFNAEYVRNFTFDVYMNDDDMLEIATVANLTTILQCNDVLALRSRHTDQYYPQSATKYIDPPSTFTKIYQNSNHPVLFEDDYIAIVNKPEGIDTIGEKRCDLQSALPFILRPPKNVESDKSYYLPRPVHRLDRGTSGCVMVAKSVQSMKYFSSLFSKRRIQKNYCAIVIGNPTINVCAHNPQITEYSIIDYPIDGKDAVTLWKIEKTVTAPRWGQLSLLRLVPKTGRYHQIRRHMSYCLSCAIVGDPKYDGGGELAKQSRELGLFLCSNSIQFKHFSKENEDDNTVSISIPLPDKFYDILGLKRQDVPV